MTDELVRVLRQFADELPYPLTFCVIWVDARMIPLWRTPLTLRGTSGVCAGSWCLGCRGGLCWSWCMCRLRRRGRMGRLCGRRSWGMRGYRTNGCVLMYQLLQIRSAHVANHGARNHGYRS